MSLATTLLMKKPKPPLITYLHRRVKKFNQNAIVAITGGTGSGKSYTAISLACSLAIKNHVDFNSEHIVFTAQEFLELLTSGKLKKGSIIILDESGVAANSKRFMSQSNLALNYVVQTFRSFNYVVFLCTPDLGFNDASLRKMFHLWLETKKIDRTKKLNYVIPRTIYTSQRTGKVYYPYLRRKVYGQMTENIVSVAVPKPPDDILEDYEEKKKRFNTKLLQEMHLQVQDTNSHEQQLTIEQELVWFLRNKYRMSSANLALVLEKKWSNCAGTLKAAERKKGVKSAPVKRGQTYTEEEIEKIKEEVKQHKNKILERETEA